LTNPGRGERENKKEVSKKAKWNLPRAALVLLNNILMRWFAWSS
jgi:hypothetical protein